MNMEMPGNAERNVLVEVLKTKGFEDPESRELMIAWCERREREVTEAGTREAQINFEIERADIYLEAGSKVDALQAYEDALMIAINEGQDELAKTIEEKIASLQ